MERVLILVQPPRHCISRLRVDLTAQRLYLMKNSFRSNLSTPSFWPECPSVSTSLIADRFFAFKTPLNSRYDSVLAKSQLFSPKCVIDACQKITKNKIRTVIDLTNSRSYYDPADFTMHGINHVKILCVGHKQCPDQSQISKFIKSCSNTIENFPNSVIGVHCTHGFNRTGYMICYFLVEQLDFSLDAAIRLFKEARHPGIYKQDYLNSLIQNLGDADCDIDIDIENPEWRQCDDNEEYKVTIKRRKVEALESTTSKLEESQPKCQFAIFIPDAVTLEADQAFHVLKSIRDFINVKKYKGFLGYQPVSMDRMNIEKLRYKEYRVSWKADGTRYLCYIQESKKTYFIDRSNLVHLIPNLTFPSSKDCNAHLSHSLLDGELIVDKVNGVDVYRYLIYDIVVFEGLNVGECYNFDQRHECILKEIIQPRYNAMLKGAIRKENESFSIRRKDFWQIITVRKILDGRFAKQVSHDVDGLIFQPVELAYTVGSCDEILKWKPGSLNSVDFRVKIVNRQKVGEPVRKIGLLYTMGMTDPFSTMIADDNLCKLNGKIIECTWENDSWKFLRERTDKNHPNNIDTAIAVCKSIQNPVTKNYLFSYIASCLKIPNLPE
ncbi:hypothetical protein GJ496_012012 [Pomphorhynchus laevis]|nr:hypothetical protein GJ496_012012 [Pomphorhynchus laevis]